MNDNILNCCKNNPSFTISYSKGHTYHVCTTCIQNSIWSEGIISKHLTSNVPQNIGVNKK